MDTVAASTSAAMRQALGRLQDEMRRTHLSEPAQGSIDLIAPPRAQ
ncbi:hypothetical protein [Xanthomonas sacchari]|nr:hypothetical protein [Xanthomonas sacchari]